MADINDLEKQLKGESPADRAAREKRASDKGSKPRSTSSAQSVSLDAIREQLVDMYSFIGMGVTVVRPNVGAVWQGNVERMADSWITAAKHDKKLRARLERMLTVSVYGTIMLAHLPVVIAFAKDSGKIPEGQAAVLDMVAHMAAEEQADVTFNDPNNTGG